MSYLSLPEGIPDFSQAVISLWFRVPASTIQAAADDANSATTGRRLLGIVPLLTFGKLNEGYIARQTALGTASFSEYSAVWGITTGWRGPTFVRTNTFGDLPIYYAGDATMLDPSFIGLDCSGYPDSPANLSIRLQTGALGSGDQMAVLTHYHSSDYVVAQGFVNPADPPPQPSLFQNAWSPLIRACVDDWYYPHGELATTVDHNDYSDIFMGQWGPVETFSLYSSAFLPDGIAPDTWHHLLLSFDVSGGPTHQPSKGDGALSFSDTLDCTPAFPGASFQMTVETFNDTSFSVENPCKVWVAVDDVNYAYPTTSAAAGLGPQDWASDNVLLAARWSNSEGTHQRSWEATGELVITTYNHDLGKPTYTAAISDIIADTYELGIPSTSDLTNAIYPVEMAELQFFTGVTLDTSDESNRRAFVDSDGVPVDPSKQSTSDTDPSGSIELLGQRPDILLHGAQDWINGRNTGPMIDDPNNPGHQIPDPDKQFIYKGEIDPYSPAPSLHGDQGAPGLRKVG
jgi:hypothetical protein